MWKEVCDFKQSVRNGPHAKDGWSLVEACEKRVQGSNQRQR